MRRVSFFFSSAKEGPDEGKKKKSAMDVLLTRCFLLYVFATVLAFVEGWWWAKDVVRLHVGTRSSF